MVLVDDDRLEQRRFKEHDPSLQAMLDDHYLYITQSVDRIMTRAIEEVLLYQPDQTADFLARHLRGTLDPKNYHYVEVPRQAYYDRKVRHLLTLAIISATKDRPDDLEVYLAEFFEARTKYF
ncbi:TPA: hypothetical protein N0F65_008234 [Lagenidium giganteum]|uniref:Uncharacterized protein n=1 Tax=Lagenidium giganteum TaxID=4803 RepID=A0AAV2Z156_9STRA|nr:TPA: hypothetical protein N0F65_008234 [Lagenidium giganteum]